MSAPTIDPDTEDLSLVEVNTVVIPLPPHQPTRRGSKYTDASNMDLVNWARDGDTEAFGHVYDRYLDVVFRFTYFRVGVRQLAEDLTAETFIRALRRIGSFEWQGRDFAAWLVTIARNLVCDHFKSGRHRFDYLIPEVGDAPGGQWGEAHIMFASADHVPSPEDGAANHLRNVALLTAVKQLNPEQQECVVLRFLHDFTVAETAQAMGKNEGAIKALQYRAIRSLNRLLPDGFER